MKSRVTSARQPMRHCEAMPTLPRSGKLCCRSGYRKRDDVENSIGSRFSGSRLTRPARVEPRIVPVARRTARTNSESPPFCGRLANAGLATLLLLEGSITP